MPVDLRSLPKPFTPRTTGGHQQKFCAPKCRTLSRRRKPKPTPPVATKPRLRVKPVLAPSPGATSVRKPVTADAIAAWSESNLTVPTGRLQGQPFVLEPWQVEWLDGALHPDTSEAGLSVSRKNGKSGLLAAALHYHLKHPPCRNWRAGVLSLTAKLSAELKKQMVEIADSSNLDV